MEKKEWKDKTEKYFSLLHPDFEALSPEEKWKLYDDKNFIIENTDAIHDAYSDFNDPDSPRWMNDASEQEKMQNVMWHVKVEKYFSLLHPDFESLSSKEKWDLYDEKKFIIENIDAIHDAYRDFSSSDSPRWMKNASEQERIKAAITEVKTKVQEKTTISPREVIENALESGIDKESTDKARNIENIITDEKHLGEK